MTQTVSETFSGSPQAADTSIQIPPDLMAAMNEQDQIKKLVGWIGSQYGKMKSERQRFERQWAINLAFVAGKQNVKYFPGKTGAASNGRLVTPPSPSYVSKRIINRIRPVVRTEMARVLSNKPNASVVPASTEEEDLFAAQAGEQIWECMYAGKQLLKTFGRSAFWLVTCGSSFMKMWWDPNAWDEVSKADGSVVYAPVSPFHLYVPDLMEPEIENQPYVFNVYTKTVDWVRSTYKIDAVPSVASKNDPLENAMFVFGTNEAVPDSCLVIEAWFKPGGHPLFPEGGYVTLVDEKVVDIRFGQFYEHRQYPFIKFDNIPTGMFYGESVVTDLLDPQREYNRTRNQINDSKNRMAKPQLVAPKGSVDPSRITSEPGLVIEYKPGLAPPQPLPLQGLPSYVTQELQNILMDIEDISSQHAVSRGGTTSGVTAATAINFMQERDDALMTTTYQSIEFGWEKIAKQTLALIVQFWDEPRMVTVTGIDHSYDVITLKGTELKAGTDIRMEAGSALPVSKAAKQALLMDLMKMGLVPPDKGLSLMEMGGIDKLYEEIKIDEQQAQRENVRMRRLDLEIISQHMQQVQQVNSQIQQSQDQISSGQPLDQQAAPAPMTAGSVTPDMAIPGAEIDPNTGTPLQMPPTVVNVNSWDNHQVHVDVHNRFRKTQAFELLPDLIKQQFEYHVQMHQQALFASMQPTDPNAPVDPNSAPMEGTEGEAPPSGGNQFGPAGTQDGSIPPDMMGAQNG